MAAKEYTRKYLIINTSKISVTRCNIMPNKVESLKDYFSIRQLDFGIASVLLIKDTIILIHLSCSGDGFKFLK